MLNYYFHFGAISFHCNVHCHEIIQRRRRHKVSKNFIRLVDYHHGKYEASEHLYPFNSTLKVSLALQRPIISFVVISKRQRITISHMWTLNIMLGCVGLCCMNVLRQKETTKYQNKFRGTLSLCQQEPSPSSWYIKKSNLLY